MTNLFREETPLDLVRAFAERFVVSCEKIASALEGLNETHRQQFGKQYPERRETREAVVTRVPTAEDRIREAHGASSVPIAEWLSDVENEEEEREFIGVREREWLNAHQEPESAQEEA